VSYRGALLLAPLLAGAPVLHAETLYVIEQLVVNVNNAPDATGTRVTTIKSGDTVEVIERQGDQVHVHLANGTEGWVRKSYLSQQEPLQHRLNERNAEVEKLKQDVARLESEVAAAKAAPHGKPGSAANGAGANASGTSAGSAGSGPANAARATGGGPGSNAPTNTAAASTGGASGDSPGGGASRAGAEDDPAAPEPTHEPPYFMTPPDAPARPVWHWALGSFVVALGLGFVLGWQMLDRRIRRKYGGLRIY
jgi:Bacterial SH3 domain